MGLMARAGLQTILPFPKRLTRQKEGSKEPIVSVILEQSVEGGEWEQFTICAEAAQMYVFTKLTPAFSPVSR